ncbi:MAG: hypothetical protein EVA65_13470 [Oceanococcus sp.]|nr:MAG: hypothetical protein EVA65_13470 [Oceanococcus sp.]
MPNSDLQLITALRVIIRYKHETNNHILRVAALRPCGHSMGLDEFASRLEQAVRNNFTRWAKGAFIGGRNYASTDLLVFFHPGSGAVSARAIVRRNHVDPDGIPSATTVVAKVIKERLEQKTFAAAEPWQEVSA